MLFSILCGLGQFITQFVLQFGLIRVPSLTPKFQYVYMGVGDLYLFNYDSIADFIGFLAGAVVGNTLTFILNRKKTFRATNNVVIAAIMYFFLAVFITLVQTLAGGWVSYPCFQAAGDLAKNNGFIDFLCRFAGMAVGGLLALVISFLGNKYLVMRNWGEGKKKKAEKAAAANDSDAIVAANDDTTENKAENVDASVVEKVEEEKVVDSEDNKE